jgi:DNA-binding CsgD family transcriptional regulator
MNQAHSALDAFGNAALAITPVNSRIVWQTPLARQWMQKYFPLPGAAPDTETPAALAAWLAGGAAGPLTIARASSRLVFSLAEGGGGDAGEQRMIVLREESDGARLQALMALFRLTQREAEVLHWAMMGKTNRDIGDILGTSPRTVNKHLEHVFHKLGVETRTAAAALAVNRLRGSSPDGAAPADA